MEIHPIANHSTLPDIPSSAIADHTGFLDLGGTRPMTGELVLDGNISAAGSGIDFSAENLTNIGTLNCGVITATGAGHLFDARGTNNSTVLQLFNDDGDGTARTADLDVFIATDSTINAVRIGGFKSNNTIAAPATASASAKILDLRAVAYADGAYHTTSEIRFSTDSDFANGTYSGIIDLRTVIAGTGLPVSRLLIDGAGDLVIFGDLDLEDGGGTIAWVESSIENSIMTGNWAFTAGNLSNIGTIGSGAITSTGLITGTGVNVTDDSIAYQIGGSTILTNEGCLRVGVNAGGSTPGTTNVFIGLRAGQGNDLTSGRGDNSVYIGEDAGRGNVGANNKGTQNVGIGKSALTKNNTGVQNVALGYLCGQSITTGSANMLIGANVGRDITEGSGNIYIGNTAGFENVTGSNNTCIGTESALSVAGNSHSNNTFVGFQTGTNITTGSNNLFLGCKSGTNQTTAGNIFLLDNQDRGSAAAELTDSLIYGTFNATAASQILRINAELQITENAKIDYDGTDLVIDPAVVGSGVVSIPSGMKVGDGGTTNYLEVKTDGDLSFVGTAQVASNMPFENAKFLIFDKASGNGIKVDTATPTFGFADLLGEVFARNTGANKPTRATWKGGTRGFQFGVNDEEEFEFHIPHDYVKGTDIFLHLHWGHNVTTVTGGTVTFDYDATYAKGHNQGVFGANAVGTVVSGTVTSSQYSHDLSEGQFSISGASATQIDTDDLEPDGVIKITIGVSANDITVSGGGVPDPFIHYVDIHYNTTSIIGTKSRTPDFYA